MGCFDTFVGKIECPHCKEQTRFNEQTKNYECLMQDFKVGDYIDKGNANYFYKFEYPCEHCKEEITINAAIRRGQLIGYYTDTTNLDINSMENIEEKKAISHESCTMCYRCINNCPVQAITLLGDKVVQQSVIEKYL